MYEPGERVVLKYPKVNHVAFAPEYVERSVCIYRIRDLVSEPLSIEEYCRRPYVRRSRWMLSGVDQANGEWRQFYAGSILGRESPGLLRVGLFIPGEKAPWRILTDPIGPTPQERTALARWLRRWSMEKKLGDFKLGVFCDDLRLVGRQAG